MVSRRNRSSEGGMPRRARRAAYGKFASGSAIRLAHPGQEARIHDRGGADARSGSGGEYRHFSIVNAVLLRSLPFPEPDRLVKIFFNNPGMGMRGVLYSLPELDDLRHRSGVFEYVTRQRELGRAE